LVERAAATDGRWVAGEAAMSAAADSGASSGTIRNPLPGTSRYELVARIAAGGMATVYVGRHRGAAGFWRLCAIKRAHPHLVEDGELRRSLVAEARLASRIQHPNVVSVSDVEELEGELLLVMDYVEGATLTELLRHAADAGRRISPRCVVRIVLDACAGLGAAHGLAGDDGAPLGLVHRDVSPQNVLVGSDGRARILDFGIAKVDDAAEGTARTATGLLKGKVGYMSPEYLQGRSVDARSDLFALGAVLWEALAGERLFRGDNHLETMMQVRNAPAPPASRVAPGLGDALDAVLARALEKSPARRYPSTAELAAALESAARKAELLGTHAEVAAEVEALAGAALARRRAVVRERLEHGAQADSASGLAAGEAASGAASEDAEGGSIEVTVSDSAFRDDDAQLVGAGRRAPAVRRRRGVLMGLAAAVAAVAVGVIASLRGPSAVPADPSASGSVADGEPASGLAPSGTAAAPAATTATAAPAASATASGAGAAQVASAAPRTSGSPAPAKGKPVTRPRRQPDQPDPNPYGPAR
jgi:eukaryotic-like serine/threonine-protein kinase